MGWLRHVGLRLDSIHLRTRMFKMHTGTEGLSVEDGDINVDIALCYGWRPGHQEEVDSLVHMIWTKANGGRAVPNKWLWPTRQLLFDGMMITAPREPLLVLDAAYTSDWAVTCKETAGHGRILSNRE